jgi:hypothetical protein
MKLLIMQEMREIVSKVSSDETRNQLTIFFTCIIVLRLHFMTGVAILQTSSGVHERSPRLDYAGKALEETLPMKANIKPGRGASPLCALSMLPVLLLSASVAHAAGGGYNEDYSQFSRTSKVDLGGAGHFVILTETGITDVPASVVTGNVGVSPITGAADHLSCAEVTGKVYSVDNAGPAPCNIMDPSLLTTAIGDMQSAYTNAAGRTATISNLGGGNIGGLTLRPGVYNWTSGVTIPSNVTIRGGSHAVWIFQIAGDLNVSSGAIVALGRHAQAQNIFWQVGGATTLGSSSHLEGIVLDATAINLGTNASINGRLLAQTAATLQMNTITAP